MKHTLDYSEPPASKSTFGKLTWAAVLSVVEHLLVFGLYAPRLDGGRLVAMCGAVSLGFWLVVLMIVLRRPRHPSKLDLAFVAFGYPVILFPCVYGVTGEL
ncbi:MAG TPA: hypothetical protein VF796_25535 [Humisphaera sp.]